jgi:hypothetical protein
VIVPIIMANSEHTDFNEAALVVTEFAFLIPAIFGEDVQRLVFSYGGIAAHGLIIHCDSAIHSTALDEVFENIGNVTPLVLETIVSALDLPAFLLGAQSGREKGGANGEDDQGDNEQNISICKLHSRLLQGTGPLHSSFHFNSGGGTW